MTKKTILSLTLLGTIIVAAIAGGYYTYLRLQPAKTIKVGILHSLTGTMAISEVSVVEATLLAIEEINRRGGVLGRQIEPVVADGRSDWPTFAAQAEKLITQDKVSTIFGCWTSASRKTVKPLMEQYNHLLFYPVQYEGLEQSPNIVYTGAAPNQQIIPAIKWSFDKLGKRFFVVGSDYVFPRTASVIIKEQLNILGGTVIGEEYLLLGSTDVKAVVQKIIQTQPDVILNTINGDTNLAFFKELKAAGVSSDKMPVMSFSIAEDELRSLSAREIAGNYATWNYFQSIDSPDNISFVKRFKEKYGQQRVTDDPMEAAYVGVYLWAQTVETAGSENVEMVRKAMRGQSMLAPEGIIYLDTETQHLWKNVRIGKITEKGQFDIVWNSERPIRPVPYPIYRSRLEWDKFLDDMYTRWDQSWASSGKTTK